jgi:hypothetical protein
MTDTTIKPSLKSFIERPSLSILADYMLTTATHGLRNIGGAYTKLHRAFWIITFLAAFGLMLYFVTSCVLQYVAYPTQTSIEIEADRDMAFPAVTVCNSNPYKTDQMNAALVTYAQSIGLNASSLTAFELEELALPLLVDLFNRNQLSEISNIGFQLENFLLDCSYNGINCSSNFVGSLSSVYGNCFTFNWEASMKQLYTLNDMSSSLVTYQGLSLTFYVPTQLNFPMLSYYDGLILMLHDNDEIPYIVQNGLRLQPGLAHTITYQKSQTTFLSMPYTNCTSTVEADLQALYETTFNSEAASEVAYSEEVCYELCEQAYVFSQCSCVLPTPFFMQYVFGREHDQLIAVNSCMPFTDEATCAVNAVVQLELNSTLLSTWCSRCVSQCTYTYFSPILSALAAPTQAQKTYWSSILLNNMSHSSSLSLPNDFASNYDAYMDANYLQVTITCGNSYVTINKQEAKLTIVDTFAAIGGQTGL